MTAQSLVRGDKPTSDKRCPRCRMYFPRDPAYMKVERHRYDGHTHFGCCKSCDAAAARERYHRRVRTDNERARNAERNRRYRKQHPERYRATSKRWRDRKYEDPEYRAQRNGDQRINYRLRNERRVGTLEVETLPADEGGYTPPPRAPVRPIVSVAPLVEWLRWAFPGWAIKTLAEWVGVDEAQNRRMLDGELERVSLHTADRILVGAGRPDLLVAFYPMEDA